MDPQIESDMSDINLPSGVVLDQAFGLILLTGASGMLGGYILESLILLSKLKIIQLEQVVVPVRSVPIYLKKLEATSNDLIKIISYSEIDLYLEERSFNTIFHFASPSSISKINSDAVSVFDTNLLMTIKFCSHLIKSGGKIFFASSGEVYGENAVVPTTENDYSNFSHLLPSGLYAESKRAAESYLFAHSNKFGYDAISLRIYHTFGPGLNIKDTRIFGEVVQSIVTGIPFEWKSNGEVTRNFLYSLDLVRAILVLAPTSGFNVFNVAGDQEIKIVDFVGIARNLSSQLIFPLEPKSKENIGHTKILRGSASIDKLANLNWNPTVSIEEALVRTCNSQKWRMKKNYTDF